MRNGYFAFGGKVEMTTPTVFAFMYWKFSNKLVDHRGRVLAGGIFQQARVDHHEGELSYGVSTRLTPLRGQTKSVKRFCDDRPYVVKQWL